MKKNLPITGIETSYDKSIQLVSSTDAKGTITYVTSSTMIENLVMPIPPSQRGTSAPHAFDYREDFEVMRAHSEG